MVTPKKILIQDLELADEEIRRLRKENKSLKERIRELEDVSKDYDILSKDFITATGEIEFRKDEVERFKQNAMRDMDEITKLEQENKNLKLIQETNENQIKNDIKERDELREKIQTLELWLDNKEKLNEEYRKQLDKRQQGEYRYFGNDGESDLYEDV